MNHTEKLTRYVGNFVDELVCSGLEHVVLSPGSRSTPLAMMMREHEAIKEHIVVDERGAAFFALGMAKETKKPVAIVCTSGTAAANYFPAIVEAKYARVPLIVLTADRPHELRAVGASQTIDQVAMYGNFVHDFTEMALPEATEEMLRYVRQKASRAVRIAMGEVPGPVQLNFPFREPLVPDFSLDNIWGSERETAYNPVFSGEKRLSSVELQELAGFLQANRKGVLVCGPQVDPALGEAISKLSKTLNIPVLADPLSQLRAGSHDKETVITAYDAFLRTEKVRTKYKPDYIIRFGAMPISKNYLFYVTEHGHVPQFVVDTTEAVREPTNDDSNYILADAARFCEDILPYIEKKQDPRWLQQWQKAEGIARGVLQSVSEANLTEGIAIREVSATVENDSIIFVANSMPVRDLETFFKVSDKNIEIHANRGVSGIDGTIATALGMAAASSKHVTLMIGDLSFYHDMNSLLIAKQYGIQMTILLINNDGGGIFSFLPQSKEEKHFEALFGTPLGIDFVHAVKMFGGVYEKVTDAEQLISAYEASLRTEGLTVLEVETDREENVHWHRALWDEIMKQVQA